MNWGLSWKTQGFKNENHQSIAAQFNTARQKTTAIECGISKSTS